MGKKKGRHAAKTGDQALYRKRNEATTTATSTAASTKPRRGSQRHGSSHDDENDNHMYNEVDRYHKLLEEQEFIKLDHDKNDDDEEDDDDGITGREAIMDLAAGGETSSEEEDEGDFDDEHLDEHEENAGNKGEVDDDEEEDEEDEAELSSENDDDHDDGDDDNQAAFHWGKRKSAYYQGDTPDLEIGQDVEDAFLEEEAAKELQAARLKEMSEDDFMLSDTDEKDEDTHDNNNDINKSTTTLQSIRTKHHHANWSKLSQKEQRKFLETRHAELLPLAAYFGDVIRDWNDRTRVATKALFESDDATAEAVGATTFGKEYLLTKSLLQTSMALHVVIYLLLKSEHAAAAANAAAPTLEDPSTSSLWIQAHPVMERLQQLNSLALKLEDRVETKIDNLPEQLDNLAKAAVLMQEEGTDVDKNDDDNESDGDNEATEYQASAIRVDHKDDQLVLPGTEDDDESAPKIDDSHDSDDDQDGFMSRSVLNDAKFGLRAKDLVVDNASRQSNIKLNKGPATDFGDDDDVGRASYKGATATLSATINSIKQRAETHSRKRQRAPVEDEIEFDDDDDDENVRRGLEMMEADLARYGGSDEEGGDLRSGDNGDDDDFYNKMKKKSKAKKEFKKEMYQVAPKYPRMDEVVDGERAINKTILKNRGLVAHKAKINRNPRVKHREHYRKAIIRRKGAVRDIRTNEGHQYGGEATGVKTNLSRSRKLGGGGR